MNPSCKGMTSRGGSEVKNGFLKTTKGKVIVGSVAAIVVIAGVLAGLYFGGIIGKGASESNVEVFVDEPKEGRQVMEGDVFRGHVEGASRGEVVLWLEGVNVKVSTKVVDSQFNFEWPGTVEGTKTLVFVHYLDGKYGIKNEYTYGFEEPVIDEETELVSDDWPVVGPVAGWIERGIRDGVGLLIEAGAEVIVGESNGDLDDNGVNDQWEGPVVSPDTPIAGKIPYLRLALVLLVFLVLPVALIAWRWQSISNFFLERRRIKKEERLNRNASLKAVLLGRQAKEARILEQQIADERRRYEASLAAKRAGDAREHKLRLKQLTLDAENARRNIGVNLAKVEAVNKRTEAEERIRLETLDARESLERERLRALKEVKKKQLSEAGKAQKLRIRETARIKSQLLKERSERLN